MVVCLVVLYMFISSKINIAVERWDIYFRLIINKLIFIWRRIIKDLEGEK